MLDKPHHDSINTTMSESSGAHTASLPNYNQQGTARVPLRWVTTVLQNEPSRDEPGHGKIFMRGRDTMMCYIDEVKTRAAVDDESYLHSGDVGSLNTDVLCVDCVLCVCGV